MPNYYFGCWTVDIETIVVLRIDAIGSKAGLITEVALWAALRHGLSVCGGTQGPRCLECFEIFKQAKFHPLKQIRSRGDVYTCTWHTDSSQSPEFKGRGAASLGSENRLNDWIQSTSLNPSNDPHDSLWTVSTYHVAVLVLQFHVVVVVCHTMQCM
jgi:hypothetical protein